jgi:hypothetical protein
MRPQGFATGRVGFVNRGRTALTSIFSLQLTWQAYYLHEQVKKGKGCHHNLFAPQSDALAGDLLVSDWRR